MDRPELTEQLMAASRDRRVGPAYLQNGADHGSLRPDLDVAATANAVGPSILTVTRARSS
jgi:hypothetical protein